LIQQGVALRGASPFIALLLARHGLLARSGLPLGLTADCPPLLDDVRPRSPSTPAP